MLLQLVSKALNPAKQGIEQPVSISEGVAIPEDAYIGAFAYIGKNVQLGKGVQIYPNTYIGDNVVIGENTILYAGVKVYAHSVIGANCILHAGVVVGSDGFGFEPNAQGVNQKIPQIGNVIIEDDVEIGANTTIDRAMMGSTIIRRNVKIDNLVQIAHNVEVGESTFLCAQVGIAGSSKIGKHCVLAGQVDVIQEKMSILDRKPEKCCPCTGMWACPPGSGPPPSVPGAAPPPPSAGCCGSRICAAGTVWTPGCWMP